MYEFFTSLLKILQLLQLRYLERTDQIDVKYLEEIVIEGKSSGFFSLGEDEKIFDDEQLSITYLFKYW